MVILLEKSKEAPDNMILIYTLVSYSIWRTLRLLNKQFKDLWEHIRNLQWNFTYVFLLWGSQMPRQRRFYFLFYANYGFIPAERNTMLISKSSYAAFHFHFFPTQQADNVGTEFQTSLIMALKGKGTYSNFHPLPPMSTAIVRFLALFLWDLVFSALPNM